MNSSIACLSNCTELTTYFLSGKYKEDINKNNKEGVGGKLAFAWYDLLKEYWMTSTKTGNPVNIKIAVSKKAKKFSGFSQQDSNEFMTEFLSILSEDLNKNDKKNYKELKEKQDDETDLQCAIRFWKMHLERNDSIITDLFSGLLKSEVICNLCNFVNITFDPFNTLTLAIPDSNKFKIRRSKYDDIQLFYIPKYSLKTNLRLRMRVKKQCPLKEVQEEIKKIKKFQHNIKSLKFVQVLDGKFIRFVDENEYKKEKDFVFVFEDESNGDENVKIFPLYMNKNNKDSAFPRLLFLKEDMKFGDLKKKIYYFARNFFKSPFTTAEKECELDKEIKKYKEAKKTDNYEETKLVELYDKEDDEIFNSRDEEREEIKKFLNDFPYYIMIKNKFEEREGKIIFDRNNNVVNLKEYEIENDESSINILLKKMELNECLIYLFFKSKSSYALNTLKIDSCENLDSPDFNKKDKLALENLLDYFCSDEYLEKGNEWFCNKCKKKVKVKKKFSIFFVPRLLIICLNRFAKNGGSFNGTYGKNSEFIDFPLKDLDMGKYICGPDKDYSKYDLFAVSQHFGGTGGGHYTAMCKNIDGNWYDYNDSSCTLSTCNNVVSSSAYVLFYRKQNW